MQLKNKISLAAATLLVSSSLMAENYMSIQYIQYDESDDRATITTPSLEISKDIGVDYTLKVGLTSDTVSGASPLWNDKNKLDASSGASNYTRAVNVDAADVQYSMADYDEERTAVSTALTTRFASRDELTVGVNYSTENDYESRELSAEYMHYLDGSKNKSITAGISYQGNEVEVPCYLDEECDVSSGGSEYRSVNVIAGEVGFMQVIDANAYTKASVFFASEDGYLSNPYMNVVRERPDNANLDVVAEVKPDERLSYGITGQYTRALTPTLSSNTTYRFYNDDWGIQSHTIGTEMYYELGSSYVFGFGLRYYTQSEADFYKSEEDINNGDYFSNNRKEHGSSDERMREFDAMGYKFSTDYKHTKNLSYNLGLNYYKQKDTFNAKYYNIGLKYKF